MKCPLCKLEMRITKSRNILVDDDTPDKETKLYVEMDLSCKTPECPNNGKVVQTIREEEPIG